MARIRSYENDNTLSLDDKVLGTDSNGNVTKNFVLSDLKDFLESGVDVVIPVPKGYFSVTNQTNDNVIAAGVYQQLTPLAVNVSFYPSGTHTGEHDNVGKGIFSVFADGANWYLDIKSYDARYSIPSFEDKFVEGVWGVNLVNLSFTVKELEKDGTKDYHIDEDGNIIWRFNIDRTNPDDWNQLTEVNSIYREFHVNATNNTTTLDLATIIFNSDVNSSVGSIDDLTTNQIYFRNAGDGLTFGSDDDNITVQLDSSGNVVFQNLEDNDITIGTDVSITDSSDLTVSGTTNVQDLNVNGDIVKQGNLESEGSITVWGENPRLFVQYHDPNAITPVDNRNIAIGPDGITRTWTSTEDSQEITYVIGNGDFIPGGGVINNQGTLRQIQIGQDYWTIPTASSQVAQLLPGLSQDLVGVPGEPTEAIRQTPIGSRNDTAIASDDSTTYSSWITANGNFAFYSVGATESLDITTSATNFTTDATSNLTPLTTNAAITGITGKAYLAIYANDEGLAPLGKLGVGDSIRIYPGGATDAQYFQLTATQVSRVNVNGTTLFLFENENGTITSSGTNFDIDASVVFDVEGINNSSAGITATKMFYGIDHGTYAEFKSVAGSDISLALDVGDTSKTFAQSTNIRDAFAAIPLNQRLFIIENLPSDISDGETVPGNSYEVVGFDYDNGDTPAMSYIQFSLIGLGNLVISTPDVTFANLTTAPTEETFLVLDTDNKVHKKELTDIAGLSSIVNYVDTGNEADNGTVQSITFESSPDNHAVSTNSGNIVVDVTGRFKTNDEQEGGFEAVEWNSYVLAPINVDQIITLPTTNLTPGDTIRIYDLSDIDTNGTQMEKDAFWTLNPGNSNRIMKLPAGDTLKLNQAIQFDIIWSGISSIGWILK